MPVAKKRSFNTMIYQGALPTISEHQSGFLPPSPGACEAPSPHTQAPEPRTCTGETEPVAARFTREQAMDWQTVSEETKQLDGQPAYLSVSVSTCACDFASATASGLASLSCPPVHDFENVSSSSPLSMLPISSRSELRPGSNLAPDHSLEFEMQRDMGMVWREANFRPAQPSPSWDALALPTLPVTPVTPSCEEAEVAKLARMPSLGEHTHGMAVPLGPAIDTVKDLGDDLQNRARQQISLIAQDHLLL